MAPIAKEHHSTIISRIKVMSELDISERRVPQDGRFKTRYKGRSIDFRVSIMPSIHGEDAVIRILDKESLSEKFRSLNLEVVGFSVMNRTRSWSEKFAMWRRPRLPFNRRSQAISSSRRFTPTTSSTFLAGS